MILKGFSIELNFLLFKKVCINAQEVKYNL